MLAELGYNTDYLIDSDYVWTHGLGEQKRYAVQHTLRFQVWELDQPHLLQAHTPRIAVGTRRLRHAPTLRSTNY